MKKLLIVLLVVLVCISLIGCRRAQENAVENMLENMLGKEGLDIDIDSDDGEFVISGEDGDTTFQSDEDGMAWPGDKLPNTVPEVPGVKVTYVMSTDTGTWITFDGCTKAVFDNYSSTIAANGWEINMTMDSDGFHMITATNSENQALSLSFDDSDNVGTLTYTQQ